MKQLQKGQFFGQTNQTILINGLTLTDTEYTHSKVDWHYHVNAYFTFILQGNMIEGNRKEEYHCGAGTLLFHHWQEPHYNIKPKGFTRGFHIELEKSWLDKLEGVVDNLQGSIKIENPEIKLLLYQILKETKINDDISSASIQTLVIQALAGLWRHEKTTAIKKPLWVDKLKEILHDEFDKQNSLEYLVKTLGIHPVHLSRDFHKYFHCSLGSYVRKLRVQKSMTLLPNNKNSLTAIAFDCGFADQSHFTRCFKEMNGLTPSAYRKIIFC